MLDRFKRKGRENIDICFWVDFACIDQDDHLLKLKGISSLNAVIERCDILLTPLVDLDWRKRRIPDKCPGGSSWFEEYSSPAFEEYKSRGWTRLEFLTAATAPLHKENVSYYELLGRKRLEWRPHLIYGTRELEKGIAPLVLPPLRNSFFHRFNPLEGDFCSSSDTHAVKTLLDNLKPYIQTVKAGYTGGVNDQGEPHGEGCLTKEDGTCYQGHWVDGKRNGWFDIHYPSGQTSYRGYIKDDQREGYGEFKHSTGQVYSGHWRQGIYHGIGTLTEQNGDRYIGNFDSNKKHGVFQVQSTTGDAYHTVFAYGYELLNLPACCVSSEPYAETGEIPQASRLTLPGLPAMFATARTSDD